MINNICLVGRLTRLVDLRYTSNGTAFGSFSLAIDRTYKNQAGEKKTDYINCVIWRKPAVNLSNYTSKGSLLGVEGRLQTRSYENKEGQKVYLTEVLIENFSLLESKAVTEGRQQEPIGNVEQVQFGEVNDDDLPF